MTEVFQFYDSPIKRLDDAKMHRVDVEFQFYDSPIKSKSVETDSTVVDSVSIL